MDGVGEVLTLLAGQFNSRVREINDRGHVAGMTFDTASGKSNGAVWRDGTQYVLAAGPGLEDAATRGIDNSGDTVIGFAHRVGGTAEAPIFDTQGQLWRWNGAGYEHFYLDTLVVNLNGWSTDAAQSINDRGQIVGFGIAPDGQQRAYLLSLVPEPVTWGLMIGGFGMVGAAMRRSRAVAA